MSSRQWAVGGGQRVLPGVRRFRRGRCLRCGDSLTASVSGVCPECGTPAGKARMSRTDRRDPSPLDYAPPEPRIRIVVPWWAWLTLAAGALVFWSVPM